jgi:hypothetical protein
MRPVPEGISSDTVADVDPLLAVMVAVPAPTAVASPLLFTVASAVLDDAQAPEAVMFCVLPSV